MVPRPLTNLARATFIGILAAAPTEQKDRECNHYTTCLFVQLVQPLLLLVLEAKIIGDQTIHPLRRDQPVTDLIESIDLVIEEQAL